MLSVETSYIMTNLLEGAVNSGTGAPPSMGTPTPTASPGTGTLSSKFPIQIPSAAMIRSSAAIASDGTIYFGADDGFLYAVGAQ